MNHMTDTHRENGESEERARRERRRRARKERVLHTRISEELSEDIRRMAEELRVPVSNIVRNVLEEAFTVVESVTENVGDLIEDVVDEATSAAKRIRWRKRRRRSAAGYRTRSEWRDEKPLDVDPEPEAPRVREPDEGVLGWQPMILARAQSCDSCGESLPKGTNAFAGVTAKGIGGHYVCEGCVSDQT
jgi:hypothetical protein